MRPKVVFDLDGTLVDSSKRDYKIYVDVLSELGHSPLPFERYWTLRRANASTVEMLKESGSDFDTNDYMKRRWDLVQEARYLSLDSLIVGTKDVLRAVGEKHDLVLVTARVNEPVTRWQCDHLGLTQHFVSIVLTTGSDKTAAFSAVSPVLIVGDTEYDVGPALHLNVPVAAVASGIRSHDLLSAMNPTYLFDDINGLVQMEMFK